MKFTKTLILGFLFCFTSCNLFAKGKNIDLTKMSTSIVYAQVYNILLEADNFNGSHIKMNGIFYENQDEINGPIYQSVMTKDVTGCCLAGFDVLKGNDSIKFPKHLTEVEVEGTFSVQEDSNGITRTYLIVDSIKY